jgi:hypothetical protein
MGLYHKRKPLSGFHKIFVPPQGGGMVEIMESGVSAARQTYGATAESAGRENRHGT